MNEQHRPLAAVDANRTAADRIVVHKIAPGWGLPSLGPFTLKLEAWLRMAGLARQNLADYLERIRAGWFG